MTNPYYQNDQAAVFHGDCLDVLAEIPDASVDSVVTDPPYEISFMSKTWDGKGIAFNFEVWRHCLRVLKPGGHLLAFGGTRTSHRLVCAIEDAGFEIRDSIAWLTGSGFPKSLNVSRDQRFCQCSMGELERGSTPGIDPLEQVGTADLPSLLDGVPPLTNEAARGSTTNVLTAVPRDSGPRPITDTRADGPIRLDGPEPSVSEGEDVRATQSGMEGRRDAQASEGQLHRGPVCAVPTGPADDGAQGRLRDGASPSDGAVDRSSTSAHGSGEPHRPQTGEQRAGESGVVPDERGSQARGSWPVCGRCRKSVIPAGLGTALKPAHEPIIVARKPIRGTVAANVVEHGCGALNIDACRVATTDDLNGGAYRGERHSTETIYGGNIGHGELGEFKPPAGRWPTNVVIDEHTAQGIDQDSGVSRSTTYSPGIGEPAGTESLNYGDSGGASRFFPTFRYEAKAPTIERPTADGTAHPTVKPLELMRWLVRLVTPPHGLVLDPFAGSGTTAEACIHEHMRAITIEREADYLPVIVARLHKPMQVGFDFGEDAS